MIKPKHYYISKGHIPTLPLNDEYGDGALVEEDGNTTTLPFYENFLHSQQI